MAEIKVRLKERSYKIHIGLGIADKSGEIIESFTPHKILIITNPLVYKIAGKRVENSLKKKRLKFSTEIIPDGERYKTLATAKKLYDVMVREKIERDSLIIALGGGVIGDIAGFVAATYMRGIPFVQIPTTLLAQVDASIGGKVAVNHSAGKNLIGAFYQPKAVISDCEFLKTLNEKEYKNGLAEVIKTAAILDADFFSYIEKNLEKIMQRDEKCLFHMVKTSSYLKGKVVAEDEREGGRRAILNYGHTFGHGFEKLGNYRRFSHGETVMAGMILAVWLALQLKVCDKETAQRQEDLIRKVGLAKGIFDFDARDLIEAMERDKKKKAGKLRFILTNKIGSAIISDTAKRKDILSVLKKFTK
ncbi:MAG: 3-dehydroquinate synthase [Candidatus Schekmanbacteria bacterium]|nr:MAG: 3-dehydroquinate synthase [Candidatus Schekmanbacteria bacterium]